MYYIQLAYLHLASVVPAFFLGAFLMISKKGTSRHRRLGKIYMLLMMLTALISLCMPAQVGAAWLNHFGLIHGFSLLVLYSVPAAYIAARNHDVSRHRNNMIGVYVGGILLAGAFAFTPGRLLHTWFFT